MKTTLLCLWMCVQLPAAMAASHGRVDERGMATAR